MSKALFVIDMQEATVGENHAPMFHYDENIVSSVNGIIESTDADCIIYIRNLMKNNFSIRAFNNDSHFFPFTRIFKCI